VPARDAAALLPSTRLLLKRREVAEMQRALQSRQEEVQQRMERLAQRRQQLRQREEQLQDVTLKFNTFLKVLGWGWGGAGRGVPADPVPTPQASAERQELARVAGQDAEVTRRHRELEELLQRRQRLGQRLRSLRRFGSYLQRVRVRSGQFQDIPAMLAHFEALAVARATLAQQAEAEGKQLAQGWARLRRYQEEAASELLRTEDELAQLRARLEAAHHDVLQEESRWAHVQSTATQKTLLLGQIKLAVLNLFHLATSWLKVPVDVALEDTEAQLDMVLLCMQDLAAICAELCPRELGLPLPRLPAATNTHPPRRLPARNSPRGQ
ncbi:CC42M protein, partial [Chordeiles acutipennis]|nr:CC42M protein [Chordeiles acutipennis]